MARRRIIAVVKIQIRPVKRPRRPRRYGPRPPRRGHHGVLQAIQRRDRVPAGHGRPGRSDRVRRPLVHVRDQDAAHAKPVARGGRHPKGAKNTGVEKVGSVSKAQLEEIARTKMPDLNTKDLDAAKLQVAGTARSMGITIDD
jgi:large subunit ribosomal protein L11